MASAEAGRLRVACQTYTWQMVGDRWLGQLEPVLAALRFFVNRHVAERLGVDRDLPLLVARHKAVHVH